MLEYSPMDLDIDDPNDAPVCVCPEYFGTTAVTFCKSCGAYTDDLELIAAEKSAVVVVCAAPAAAPPPPAAPRKPMAPAYGIASIGNGLWVRTAAPKKSKRRGW